MIGQLEQITPYVPKRPNYYRVGFDALTEQQQNANIITLGYDNNDALYYNDEVLEAITDFQEMLQELGFSAHCRLMYPLEGRAHVLGTIGVPREYQVISNKNYRAIIKRFYNHHKYFLASIPTSFNICRVYETEVLSSMTPEMIQGYEQTLDKLHRVFYELIAGLVAKFQEIMIGFLKDVDAIRLELSKPSSTYRCDGMRIS